MIEARHGPMEVNTSGEGPPFLIIHSLLTGPEAFDEVARSLSATRTVHRVHLPGFGRSSVLDSDDVTIADLADVVASTMDGLGCGDSTTVMGNGLGSFVALELALRHGSRFDELIVANTGPGFPEERRGAFAEMSRLARSGGMAAVADVAIQRIFPPSYQASHPEAAGQRREVLLQVDPGAFAAACLALANLDLRAKVGAIANRTLVIVGELDQTTPPEMGRDLHRRLNGASLAVIPDCGHCPQLEQPAALLREITDFLAVGAKP